MDGQSRTVKTLTLLAASMTGGAMMLAWLEPSLLSTPGDRNLESQSDRIATVRHSIDAVLADRKGRWSFVEINTIEANASRRMMLAASREQTEFDFVISSDGELHWQTSTLGTEEPLSADDTALRIALHADDPRAPIADSQWTTLRLLLAELSARRPNTGHALTVRVQGAHADADTVDRDALQSVEQLLLRTGMAG